jgi:hypothetical protein
VIECLPHGKNCLINSRIALCIPNRGGTELSLEWALYTLRQLELPAGSQIFTARGSPVDVSRNLLVQRSIDEGFDWIGFLDTDVECPPNAFTRLLAHHKPFMAGLYRAKKEDREEGKVLWAAWLFDEDKNGYMPIANWDGNGIMEVDVIASGLMLIHRSVFEKVGFPWFKWTRDTELAGSGKGVSEDFNFCEKVKDAGFDIIIDTVVQASHICGEMKIVPDGSIKLLEV